MSNETVHDLGTWLIVIALLSIAWLMTRKSK